MRFTLILASCLVLAAGGHLTPCRADPPASPGRLCAGVATEGAEVEAVRRQELRGARMNIDGWDMEIARDFFAPDFVGIAPGGAVSDFDAVVKSFTNGRSPGWARSFELTGLDIRVHDCATAVVVGTAEARALAGPADAPPWRIRFLNIWRKDGGRWLYWANQFTTITNVPATMARSRGQ